jgi:hypothetical protein
MCGYILARDGDGKCVTVSIFERDQEWWDAYGDCVFGISPALVLPHFLDLIYLLAPCLELAVGVSVLALVTLDRPHETMSSPDQGRESFIHRTFRELERGDPRESREKRKRWEAEVPRGMRTRRIERLGGPSCSPMDSDLWKN